MLRVVLALCLCIGALSMLTPATAQPTQPCKVALVIGNGNYRSVTPLANPAHDAEAIAASLRILNFDVDLLIDADRPTMLSSIDRLSQNAAGATVALMFYAGHATEIGGQNLLLPITVSAASTTEVRRTSISFTDISQALEGRAQTTLIFLDACRDSPIQATAEAPRRTQARGSAQPGSRSVGGAGGLASVSSSSGMLVAFATAPGRVALDGNSVYSPFTEALLRHLNTPGTEVRQMLGEVRRSVREATNGQQIPWDNSSLEGNYYFVPPLAAARTLPTRYDGIWSALFTCEPVSASSVQGYTYRFVAVVRNGRLHGLRGMEGQQDSARWEGDINEDGTATLRVSGMSGNPTYTLGNIAPGTRTVFDVSAQFGEHAGRGLHTQSRPCEVEFIRG